MKIIKLFLILFGLWLPFLALAEICQPAKVELEIKDFDNHFLPGTKFAIYEQLMDSEGNYRPGKEVGSARTDQYLSSGIAKVKVTATPANYAVRIFNPTLKNADFWYFNELNNLTCGSEKDGSITLGGLRVRATDASRAGLQRGTTVTLYEEKRDVAYQLITGTKYGSLKIGQDGDVIFYVPAVNRAMKEFPALFTLGFKDTAGREFFKRGVEARDRSGVYIDFRFSELAITIRDTGTANPLPNLKIELKEQLKGQFSVNATGKTLASLTTNDNGQASIQYPAGTYALQFKYPNGQIKNFFDIKIEDENRNSYDLQLDNYKTSRCSLKSDFRPIFRDANGTIIGNLSATLYKQTISVDGNPVADSKAGSVNLDESGTGKITVAPAPADKYALEVCRKSVKFACFWFFNISLGCNNDVVFDRTLPSTSIVFRNSDGSLAQGQKFKVFVKTIDIDGQSTIDRDKTVGSFKIPSIGQVDLFLSPVNQLDEPQTYFVVVEGKKNTEYKAEFSSEWSKNTKLEYILNEGSISLYQRRNEPIDNPNISNIKINKNLLGRIVLQVESVGEAWYINPANSKRYFLGKADDAFQVMKRLSVGISSDKLSSIPVALMPLNGFDNDGDGLADDLEKALGTDPNKPDTDGDGFTDTQEVRGGYNPVNIGKMPINNKLTNAQSGKILLQVESNGEAWYVYPTDKKRYYLGRPADAFFIMRELGLGISNADLATIPIVE
ncbi:MAG: hypothetical protein PHR00_02980 [Patescibacteria group bacterium]|nr:hypothetical protein [Patescibacteria group bacterium]